MPFKWKRTWPRTYASRATLSRAVLRIRREVAGTVLTFCTRRRAKLVSEGQGAWGREQNCRAGASLADLWNGKRERLPYKSVIGREGTHESTGQQGRGQGTEVRDLQICNTGAP